MVKTPKQPLLHRLIIHMPAITQAQRTSMRLVLVAGKDGGEDELCDHHSQVYQRQAYDDVVSGAAFQQLCYRALHSGKQVRAVYRMCQPLLPPSWD